ncbi:hypothetical protein I6I68_03780 [Corynebacterium glucuronolyticum]|uniref:hypothetical protein n=1 Tax=Corynebacterium glucuronolyticum TaxID=39791 RepID=UPI00191CD4F1|nr:hypothetical protein [Corynebacterium glucuronolyticum]QQU89093.1 hypothetical protein I6I68_03780 [Corynebacterium glucuronolyticum]
MKTEKTASEKILHTNVQLSKMFDFVGVRLEWDCFLGDLIEMAYSIEEFLGAEDVEVLIRDYREDAQHGYRAVHTIIRSPAGIVEVQLRTLLQARWANAYEMLADVMGRKIRYQEIELSEDEPLGVVYSNLQRISKDIAEIEKAIESRSENTNTALMNLVNSRHFLPLSVETQVLRLNTLASLVQAETYATLSALQNARLVKHLEELAEILQEMKKMASPQPKVR